MPLERAGRLWCRGCRQDYMVVATVDGRIVSRTPETVPIACPNCKRVARVFLPIGIAPPVTAVYSLEDWESKVPRR